MLFLTIIPLYGGFLLATDRKKSAYVLPFCFLEGMLLAWYCFVFLPTAFEQNLLFTGALAMAGIILAAILEKMTNGSINHALALGMFCLAQACLHMGAGYAVQGFIGGMGLFFTSSNLFPEGDDWRIVVRMACGGVVGFLVGVILGL